MNKIVERKKLVPGVTLIKVEAPEISRNHQPGQFVILRIDEHGERVPLTVADKDPESGQAGSNSCRI
jgi:ferredoxin--NADP+ reductase